MRAVVVLNHQAGTLRENNDRSAAYDRVRRLFRDVGVEAEMVACRPAALPDRVEQGLHRGAACLVAVGGDGTVRNVAALALARNLPLGILPAGTLNHFAKDAGLPLDWTAAAAVIAAGLTRRVDAADVNERVFVNNASIGLYPHLVLARDEKAKPIGLARVPAYAVSAFSAFRRFPLLTVSLHTPAGTRRRRTPFVFVGNNRYLLQRGVLGARPRLDEGKLSLYLADCPSRRRLLRLLVQALRGRLREAEDFETDTMEQVELETPRRPLKVALDGEVVRLDPPLRFRIRPAALAVFASPSSR